MLPVFRGGTEEQGNEEVLVRLCETIFEVVTVEHSTKARSHMVEVIRCTAPPPSTPSLRPATLAIRMRRARSLARFAQRCG